MAEVAQARLVAAAIVFSLIGCSGPEVEALPPDYERTPVLFVHGSGLSSQTWREMMEHMTRTGYPNDYLLAIDLSPRDGGNKRAAELFIVKAVDMLLSRAEKAASEAGYVGQVTEKVDIVAHSMGGVSSRWYAAKLHPERVRKWVGIAASNHGTDELCGRSGEGNREMCPAFARSREESEVQVELNGTPTAPIDETPFGVGPDPEGVARVPPDDRRRIRYYTLRIEPDEWIEPERSAMLAGAGGDEAGSERLSRRFTETGSGNFLVGGWRDHDGLPKDRDVIRFVTSLLATEKR